MMAISLQYLRR